MAPMSGNFGGYNCPSCGVWVAAGMFHQCTAIAPQIQTSGTTNIYYQGQPQYVPAPPPKPESDSPLDWLRESVEEICAAGRAA